MTWKSALLEAFSEELDRHELDEPADPAGLGRRGARLTIADDRWRQHVGELLDAEQVRERLGVSSRQAVHDLVRRGRLLAVEDRAGRRAYPGAQLDVRGRPWPVMVDLLAIFDVVQETPWTLASWLSAPQELLDDQSPAVWLRAGRSPDSVVAAARQMAERLAR